MNKCQWFQGELFVPCSWRAEPRYCCCSLPLRCWNSAAVAGLILLPIFSLVSLFCSLLLLNLSWAIRKKLSLWPVIPLLFMMRVFFTSSDTFDARLCQKWVSGPRGLQGFRMHWELRAGGWGMLQMQMRSAHSAAWNIIPEFCSLSLLQLTEGIYMYLCDPTAWEVSSRFHFWGLCSQLSFHRCPSMQECANQF